MNWKNSKELLEGLLDAPDSQMDPNVKVWIRDARTKDDWEHICKVCCEASLVSDFTMKMLEIIWEQWEE